MKEFWNREVPQENADKAFEILHEMEQTQPDSFEKDVEYAERFLKAWGIKEADLDAVEERFLDQVKQSMELQDALGEQMKEILLRSGVTENQIKWKNFRNARIGFFDRMRVRKIKEASDKNLNESMANIVMLEAIAKMRAEGISNGES